MNYIYPKTETLLVRDTKTFKVIEGQLQMRHNGMYRKK